MNEALLFSALLMGLAGTPHCLAMCGAACAAVSGGRLASLWPLHLGRLLSYTFAGAVAAATVGALASLGQAVAVLRPLWTLVHAAALVLGLFLLWQGRQPAWMASLGRARRAAAQQPDRGGTWAVVRGPAKQVGVGLAWAAWPCGLLQSALLVASLANGPVQGGLVMAVFALASAGGLLFGPWLWSRAVGSRSGRPLSGVWAVRLAGLALAGASAWALGHGVWRQVAAWCLN